MQTQTKGWLKWPISLAIMLFCTHVQALDFRSVSVSKAILFDAPSEQGNKRYFVTNGYPVEVIVNLGEWIKVRDHFGALSWVQSKFLSNKRTLMILGGDAEMRQQPSETAPLLATIEKQVVVELLAEQPQNGWIKVKHQDGITGFVRVTQVWGY